MLTFETPWVKLITQHERRAIITAPHAAIAAAAAAYAKHTKPGMSIDQKIERALDLHKNFAATYRHEYREVGQ